MLRNRWEVLQWNPRVTSLGGFLLLFCCSRHKDCILASRSHCPIVYYCPSKLTLGILYSLVFITSTCCVHLDGMKWIESCTLIWGRLGKMFIISILSCFFHSIPNYSNYNYIATCSGRNAPFHFFTTFPSIFIIENLDVLMFIHYSLIHPTFSIIYVYNFSFHSFPIPFSPSAH